MFFGRWESDFNVNFIFESISRKFEFYHRLNRNVNEVKDDLDGPMFINIDYAQRVSLGIGIAGIRRKVSCVQGM